MTRVLIADDQALVRAGFRALIGSAPGMEVVGEASDGAEVVRLARELAPDVVLMDIRMPGMDGLEATRLILSEASPEAAPRILILTTFDTDEHVYEALRSGASGFLLKDTDPDHLLEAVQVIADGEALLAPSVTRRLIETYASIPNTRRDAYDVSALTDREREVVALVARGMTNAEIGRHLGISATTAKTHVSHASVKLAARDRAQLVVIAYETGLILP